MPKNSTVSESKVHPGFLTITLSVVGRFLGRPYRSCPMPKQFCRLSVVCLSTVVTRVHCAKTAEPIGTNFGMSVAPDENSTALKFGDDRFKGCGTVPPNVAPKWSNSRFFTLCHALYPDAWFVCDDFWQRCCRGQVGKPLKMVTIGPGIWVQCPQICPKMVKFALFTARCYACAVLAMGLCPCLCLCLWQAGVLLKRLNVGSHKQHHTIAQGL